MKLSNRFILVLKVTEEEIYSGLIEIPDPNDSALVFLRDIENYAQLPLDNFKLVQSFIDYDEQKRIDKQSKTALDLLKNEKIKSKISPENIHHYSVGEK